MFVAILTVAKSRFDNHGYSFDGGLAVVLVRYQMQSNQDIGTVKIATKIILTLNYQNTIQPFTSKILSK